MKKLLVGLLALASVSVFSSEVKVVDIRTLLTDYGQSRLTSNARYSHRMMKKLERQIDNQIELKWDMYSKRDNNVRMFSNVHNPYFDEKVRADYSIELIEKEDSEKSFSQFVLIDLNTKEILGTSDVIAYRENRVRRTFDFKFEGNSGVNKRVDAILKLLNIVKDTSFQN